MPGALEAVGPSSTRSPRPVESCSMSKGMSGFDVDDASSMFDRPGFIQELAQRFTEWWKMAMDHGWVADFMQTIMCEDCVIIDHVGRSTPFRAEGHAAMLQYYNKVLKTRLGAGGGMGSGGQPPAVRWDLGDITRDGPAAITTINKITIRWPGGREMYMQLRFEVALRDGKIGQLEILPEAFEMTESPSPTESPRTASPASRITTPANSDCGSDRSPCADVPAPTVVAPSPPPPAVPAPLPQAPPREGKHGGVHLTRPCLHNNWDNVRIKRGWIILRCRECHSQWRQRPSSEGRCSKFNTTEGCPQGAGCPLLHVHHFKQTLGERQRQAQQQLLQQQLLIHQQQAVAQGQCWTPQYQSQRSSW